MRRAVFAALLALAACDRSDPAPPPAPEPAPVQPSAPAPPAVAQAPAPAEPSVEPEAQAEAAEGEDEWAGLAVEEDRDRLARLPAAWELALAEAEREHARELTRLGPLAKPDSGLPNPHPSPGVYRCRTIKLGSQGEDGAQTLAYVAYPYFRCRIELTPGGDLTLAKLTGSQRVTGEFYPERDAVGRDTRRLVFLGAQAWGSDETSAPAYGKDPERDQIGLLERIGPDRYRLAFPWPRQESKLDLLELERVGS